MTNLSFLEGPKVETSNTPPFEIEKGAQGRSLESLPLSKYDKKASKIK